MSVIPVPVMVNVLTMQPVHVTTGKTQLRNIGMGVRAIDVKNTGMVWNVKCTVTLTKRMYRILKESTCTEEMDKE